MKRLLPFLPVLSLGLTACGQPAAQSTPVPVNTQEALAETSSPTQAPTDTAAPVENQTAAQSNILVVYFSHTGENYSVGTITEGNTAKVAREIAAQTGATVGRGLAVHGADAPKIEREVAAWARKCVG